MEQSETNAQAPLSLKPLPNNHFCCSIPSCKCNKLLCSLAAFLILIILSGVVYLYRLQNQPLVPVSKITEVSPTKTPNLTVYTEDTRSANWKTYTNSVAGFSLKYPDKTLRLDSDNEAKYSSHANIEVPRDFIQFLGYNPPRLITAINTVDLEMTSIDYLHSPFTLWVFDNPEKLSINEWYQKYWYYPFVWGKAIESEVNNNQPKNIAKINDLTMEYAILDNMGTTNFGYISSYNKIILIITKTNLGDQILSTFKFTGLNYSKYKNDLYSYDFYYPTNWQLVETLSPDNTSRVRLLDPLAQTHIAEPSEPQEGLMIEVIASPSSVFANKTLKQIIPINRGTNDSIKIEDINLPETDITTLPRSYISYSVTNNSGIPTLQYGNGFISNITSGEDVVFDISIKIYNYDQNNQASQAAIDVYKRLFSTFQFFSRETKINTPYPTVKPTTKTIIKPTTTNLNPEGRFCGGIAANLPENQCPTGYVCQIDGNYPDASGKCVKDDTI